MEASEEPGRARRWLVARLLSLGLLAVLGFLLARLIWLPFYFGLFFFLVAGLLAGALSFRIARAARPIPRLRILRGIAWLAAVAMAITLCWEYQHVAGTIGDPPKFQEARNAAVKAGRPAACIRDIASEEFRKALRKTYPPGGPIGYVRWAVSSGEMEISVEGTKDVGAVDQRGTAWLVRTVIGLLLMAAGLYASFESLRSPYPISNILPPGEEYEE
jgi:hypothetical protein